MENQGVNNPAVTPIGVVKATDGGVLVAVSVNGEARDLKVGDPIFSGEGLRVHSTLRIDVADAEGQIQQQVHSARNTIVFTDGSEREVPHQGIASLDANSFLTMAEVTPEGSNSEVPSFEELLAALESGQDINELLEATAAGEESAGSEGELGQGVRFDRVEQSATPEAGIDPDLAFAAAPVVTTDDLLGDAVNAFPSSQPISAQSGDDGQFISFSVADSFSDPDGALTYSASGLPEGLSIDPQTGIISGSIAADASGQNSQDYNITITVTDTGGAQVSESFLWTVSNVPPVAQNDSFDIDEDGVLQGNLLADNGNGADTDGGQDNDPITVDTTPVIAPENGTLQINADGTFIYTPNPNFSGTDSFTYSINDGQGGTDAATVTISVNEVTDLVAQADAGSGNEDGSISGNVGDNDSTTSGGVLSFEVVNTTINGSLVFSPDGSYTYTPNANFNGTDSFDYLVTDTVSGESVLQTVTLTVSAVNDPAVITVVAADTAVTEDDAGNNTASGTVTVTDVDNGEGALASSTATFGTVTVDGAGNWTYALDNGNATVQALAAGETLTDTITFTSDDGTTQTQDITITGANDAAVITVVAADTAVTEDDAGNNTASGTVTVTDVDNGEGALASSTATFGTVTVDGAGNWTYALDNGNATVQALAAGETLTDTITFISDDGTTQTQDITITGANDAAVITVVAADTAVTEDDAGNNTASGTVTVTDVDNGEGALASSTATFGTVTVDGAGNWTYALDNGNATVQALAAGETLTDTITFISDDGTTQTQDITITGANDAAVITVVAADTAVTEDDAGNNTASGTVTVTDVDNGEGALASSTATFGTVTVDGAGNWTYALDNGNATVQALAAGETLTDTITFTSDDGTTQTQDITITGANDAAVITVVAADTAVTEDDAGNNTASGTVTVTDVDNGEGALASSTATFGTVTVDGAGNWTYALDNGNATVQALAAGETLTDTITFTSDDGTTQTQDITITGANDAAVITVVAADTAVTEDDAGNNTASGTVTVTDVDNGEGALASSTATFGTVTVDGAGNWTYALDNGNATVQALAAGETLTDTITFISDDGTTQTQDITITGANDAAVITVVAADTAVTEDDAGNNTASGTVTVTDVDNGEGALASSTATFGTVTVDGAGNWTYALDNGNATVQALAAGETLTDTITFTSDDGTTQTQDITITGANDAAVITVVAADTAVTEDDAGNNTASGTVTVTDVDNGEGALASSTATFGTVTVDGAGNWTYALDNGNATVQALAAGETLTDTITFTSDDGTTQTQDITITGANDAAVITVVAADTAVTEDDAGNNTASGTVTVTDVDNGEGALASSTATFGTVTVDGAGNWTYALDNGNATVQALAAGETLTDTITFISDDGTTQTQDITITGANDAAVITVVAADTAVTEDDAGNNTASGTVTVTDVDNGEGALASSTATFGTVTVDGAGNWTYALDNGNATVQALAAGETLTDTITFTSDDGTTQIQDITITGANDAAVITVVAADTAVTEDDAGNNTASGTVTVTDVDNGEGALASSTATFGTVTVDGAGNWTYALDNGNATVQALAAGETLTDTITFTSDDGTTQTQDITITGANDAAVITVVAADTAVTEDDAGNNTASGTVTVTDVDNGEGALASSTATFGTVTVDGAGNWTYALDNGNATVQALAAGETLTDTITFTSDDGTTQIQDITITGANDAAVITVVAADTAVTEDDAGNNTASGTVTVTDVDNGEGALASSTATFGTVTVDGAGNWTYALDNGNATVQALAAGETLTDTITFTSDDGTTQTQDITITGANDAAVITVVAADTAVTEDDAGNNTASGTVTVTDVDNGEGALASSTATFGTVTVDGAGNWTYALDNGNATVQALAAGETLTDTITFISDDGTTQTQDITITGANDAAVITVVAADTAVTEDDAGNNTASGTVTVTDVDNGEGALASSTATFGTVTVDGAGNWTYALDNGNATVQALAAGETLTDTITFISDDGTTQTQDITITGANDAAVITVVAADTAVTEDDAGNNTASGTVTVTDVDNGEGALASSTATFGTVTVDGAGNWTYALDNGNATVQALAAGETLTDTITFTSDDGTTQTQDITITGANDAAVITVVAADTAVTEDDAGNNTASGTVTVTDVDNGEGALASSTATFGTVTVDGAGNWTYALDNGNATVQALAAGETLTDTITFTSDDGTTQTQDITITGANDAAVITVVAADTAVTEDDAGNNTASGTVTVTDVDNGEGALASSTATFGTVTVDGAGNWTYALDNGNATVQALAAGETLTDTITFISDDGTTQTQDITITGANDAAVITVVAADTAVTEDDAGNNTASGTVTVTDVDNGEGALASSTATFGTVTVDGAGNWTYALDNGNATVQALAAGETLTDTITFTSDDGTTQTQDITITGANDAAVITVVAADTAVTEDDAGNNTASGTVTVTDVDNGEGALASSTATFGTVTVDGAGNWTYALDNGNATVQALAAGETLTDTITFTSDDGTTQTQDITITGANDAAVITVVAADTAVTEDDAGNNTASGTVTVTDVDNGEGALASSTATFGTVTVDGAGNWTYALDNGNATVQALAAGETLTDTITFTSDDGTTQTQDITITGANDAAVITVVAADTAVTEDDAGNNTASGTVTVTDVDNGEGALASSTATFGTVTVDGAGNWTYALDNGNATVQALAAGETLTDTITFISDDGTTQTQDITITGANDAAVITVVAADTAVTEDDAGNNTASGTVTVTDVDNGEGALASSTATFGTVTVDGAGNWTYALDNGNATVQALAAGETLTDTITFISDDGTTQTQDITITGANDAAVITVVAADTAVTEDDAGNNTASGTVTVTDVDNGEGALASSTATFGTVTVDGAGNWTYALDNGNATVQALAAGETLTDTITFTSDDGTTQTQDITITGANDAAVITVVAADTAVTEDDAGNNTASGTVTVTDVDNGEGALASSTATFGTVTVDGAGNWTYALDNGNATVQALAAGETLTDTITFTSDDGTTQTQDITITGANDAAVITVVAADTAVTEDDAGNNTASGTVTVTDVDNGEGALASSTATFGTVTVDGAGNWTYALDNGNATVQALAAGETLTDTITFTSDDGTTQTQDITITGANDAAVITVVAADTAVTEDDAGNNTASGTVTVTDVDNGEGALASSTATFGTVTVDGAGNWTYALDNGNATVQALAAGETLTDTITFTSDDGTTQIQDITITGANDAAVITVVAADTAVTEDDAGNNTASGTVTVTDVDNGEGALASSTATFGTVTVDGAGNWTYALDNGNATVQALAAGETLTDTITFTSDDGTTQTQDITITGANDAAVITVVAADTAVTEDDAGNNTASGTVTVTDVDNGEGALASSTATFGTVTVDGAGNWTYALDNGNATVQALAAGETLTDTITFTSDDGTTQTQDITITGANDAAVITVVAADTAVTEDDAGNNTASGTVTVTDVDNGEGALASSTATFGTVTVDGAGNWTYALDNGNATVQALAAGETLTDTITFTSDDGTTQIQDITITGANDAAVITVVAADTAVTEDDAGNNTASGTVTVTDVDNGEGALASSTATFGTVTVDGAGNWTYALDNGNATVQALAAGETLTDTITFTSDDGTTQTQDITITGANDAAVITVVAADTAVTEDDAGNNTASGTVTVTDVDNGEGALASSTATFGTVTVDGAGNWTYALDNGNATVQALAAGETLTDTITFTSDDGTTQTQDITITGANDAAVITVVAADTAVTEDDAGNNTASGTVTVTDVDNGEGALASSTATFGTVTVDGAGNWTYALDNGNATVQALAAGETLTDTITFTSDDGTTQTQDITITGANDAAVITVVAADTAVTEDDAGNNTASGTVTVTDVDNGEGALASSTATFGTVTVDGAGNWTYALDNGNATVQALAAGETLTDTITFTSDDGTTQTQDITITGANDAAVITVVAADTAVTEDDAGNNTASGTVTVTDVDNGEGALASSTATFGTVTVDGAGNWTYALDNGNATVQALAAGETLTDTITFTSDDGTTQTQDITITGANDAAVITVVAADTAVTEDDAGNNTASGTVTVTDVDNGEGALASSTATFGTVTVDGAGNWTYALDNGNATVQALAAGETLTDTITFTSDDGTTQTQDITITGANDAAVITVVAADTAVTEDDAGNNTASGTVTVTDVDNGEGALASSTATFGTVTVDGAGNWTYALDNGNATVQALAAGETLTDTITFTSDDGTTQTQDITITGANDAAVITVVAADTAVTEDDAGNNTASGTVTVTDVDNGEGALASSTATFGTVTVDGAGNWTYALDNGNATVQALAAGETLTDTITFISDDGTTQTQDITITGANDAAVITVVAADTAVTEDDAGNNTASGTVTVTDVDNGEGALASSTATFGTVTVDGAGNWTYALDNGNATVQALAAGETLTDTITFTSDDGTTQIQDITITGANDAAVITVVAADTAVTEDDAGNNTASGTVTVTDVDNGEGALASSTATFGTVTVDGAGNWTYALDNSNPDVEALLEGETLVDTIIFTSDDGTSVTQSVTITGSNAVPIVSNDTATTSENTVLNDTVPVATDVDGVITGYSLASGVGAGNGNLVFNLDGSYSFDPSSDFDDLAVGESRDVTFNYTALDDAGGESSEATVTITVTGTNDAPIASNANAGTTENAILNSNVPAAADVDGTIASYDLRTDVGEGSLVFNPDGTFTFDPGSDFDDLAPDATRDVTFTYVAIDNNGAESNEASITITVTGTNDVPVAFDDTATTSENTVLNDTVPVATDVDGVITGYSLASGVGAGNGNLVFNLDGSYSFDPSSDFDDLAVGESRDVTFNYTALDDAGGESSEATVTITVTGTNDAPIASNANAGTTENAILNSSVPAAADVDGTIASYDLRTDVGEGSLVFNPDGTFTFDPGSDFDDLAPDATRDVTFTYVAIDNNGAESNEASITITVTGTNDVPVAFDDTATTSENTVLNDTVPVATDVDGVITGYSLASGVGAGNGNLVFNLDGSYSFDPSSDFDDLAVGESRDVTFNYTALDDAGGESSEATVTITVTGTNDAAVITVVAADTAVTEDDAGNNTASGTVTVTDVDNGEGALASSTATFGTVTVDGAGNWTYALDNGNATVQALAAGETLTDTITFTSDDGTTQTQDITITGANDAPVAVDDTFTVAEDGTTAVLDLLGNDTDVDGDSLTLQSVAGTAVTPGTAQSIAVTNGTVNIDAAGNVTFTPSANYSGPISFDYVVSDGAGGTDTATVTGTVTPVVDAPILTVVDQVTSLLLPDESIDTVTATSQADLESQLGLTAGSLDTFSPPGSDPGTVNVFDGDRTSYTINLEAGGEASFDWVFDNGEDTTGEINNGFNDLVLFVVTDPNGVTTTSIVTSSEQAGASTDTNGTQTHTAGLSGEFQFSFIVLNGRDGAKDSSVSLSNVRATNAAGNLIFGSVIPLAIGAALADTDGSETLALQVSGVPAGATLSAGTDLGGGVWSLSAADLSGLTINPPAGFTGTINLDVQAQSTESDGTTATVNESITVTVDSTTNNISGTTAGDTLTGTAGNDNISGLNGGDVITGGGGNDLIHGGGGADVITAGAGNDIVYGGAGGDNISGQAGNDILYGGSGIDTIDGGANNDIIYGGTGGDTLTGGTGADTFAWAAGDASGSPVDTITDFNTGEDLLDLSDLLSGENANNLEEYLSFNFDGSDTTITVDTNGSAAGGDSQEIVLQGVDLTAGGTLVDADIINNLITNNNLIVD
ncbi:VCBS domain-containing protein [bacterium SCSIO 12696]|nr:VCBS domain-containing protein [bacterium SCSIO 12696]